MSNASEGSSKISIVFPETHVYETDWGAFVQQWIHEVCISVIEYDV